MTPTKLKWHRLDTGIYEREDGGYRVSQAWRNEVCGNPHPMRGGYCPGEELHDKQCWQITERSENGGYSYITWENDTWDTKREAVELVCNRAPRTS